MASCFTDGIVAPLPHGPRRSKVEVAQAQPKSSTPGPHRPLNAHPGQFAADRRCPRIVRYELLRLSYVVLTFLAGGSLPLALGFESPRGSGYGFYVVAGCDGQNRLAARCPATTRPLIRKSWRVALSAYQSCDRQRVECDLIPEVVELSDEAPGGAGLAGAFDEVVRAEVVVGRVVGKHVPDGDQNRVLQRDEGPLASTAGHHSPITGG